MSRSKSCLKTLFARYLYDGIAQQKLCAFALYKLIDSTAFLWVSVFNQQSCRVPKLPQLGVCLVNSSRVVAVYILPAFLFSPAVPLPFPNSTRLSSV